MHSEIPAYLLILAGIENSVNKVIMLSGLSENKTGPGVLESSIQQARLLQHYQRYIQIVSSWLSFDCCLVVWNSCKAMLVGHKIEALQVQPRFLNSY